jgi:hypothetical protein
MTVSALLVLACLMGAIGVALMAAAAHASLVPRFRNS